MFAVMFHSLQPIEHRTHDSSYVTEDAYTDHVGRVTFSVRRLSHRRGASIQHLPNPSNVCVSCLGLVSFDTTIRDARRMGRWVLLQRDAADSGLKTAMALRILGFGARVFIVSVESAPGEPLPQDIGWFLESFRLCMASDPCPAISEGTPPWVISPFRFLPPTSAISEIFSSGADLGQAFSDYEVDVPVLELPGSAAPSYPQALAARGVEGEVVARFVVDTAGSVETPTIAIVRSTGSLFTDAVRAALRTARFLPATLNGRKVRQWVERSYPFKLPH
jgi:TonB family protein